MYSFDTDRDAREFVRARVDVPTLEQSEHIGENVTFRTFPLELSEGTFTNVYGVSFPAQQLQPDIAIHQQLTSVFDYVDSHPGIRVASGGGFFFLADRASAAPRQPAFNLGLSKGRLHSLPIVDREAVLIEGKHISAEHLQALGVLQMNNTELTWSGSLTLHDTDTKVFTSSNCIIAHMQNDATGSIRVLDESSRYTPLTELDDTVDIGFIQRDDDTFVGVTSATSGGVDTFNHDIVVRLHERHVHGSLPTMRIRTLGGKALDGSLRGGLTVGPMLETDSFTEHPINTDPSLGGKPPFRDIPLARTVLYQTEDDRVHLRLFDGRPGSPIFPGVTPNQVAEYILSEQDILWGCFLDPGQTSKLVIRNKDIASYGSSHYLKWPTNPGERFLWTPKSGRPTASLLTFS